MKKILGAALALGAALTAPALHAQGHASHGQEHAAHAQGPPPHAPLMHRQELGLSADQVARLEAVIAELHAAHREHCAGMRGMDAQQRQAHHARMQETMRQVHQRAAAALTAPQRVRLDSLHAAHHGAGGEHAAMAGRHAAQAGQHAAAGHGEHAQHGEGHEGCCDGGDCCKEGNCDEARCEECCKTCCGGMEHREEHAHGGGHSHD
ncbi:MAG TPA: hypothetical protein VEW03_16445 [Longimicrobiaceae bacterium]|nr:hypothetical protein [Longimicrobiaceae bacterium]